MRWHCQVELISPGIATADQYHRWYCNAAFPPYRLRADIRCCSRLTGHSTFFRGERSLELSPLRWTPLVCGCVCATLKNSFRRSWCPQMRITIYERQENTRELHLVNLRFDTPCTEECCLQYLAQWQLLYHTHPELSVKLAGEPVTPGKISPVPRCEWKIGRETAIKDGWRYSKQIHT